MHTKGKLVTESNLYLPDINPSLLMAVGEETAPAADVLYGIAGADGGGGGGRTAGKRLEYRA